MLAEACGVFHSTVNGFPFSAIITECRDGQAELDDEAGRISM